MEVIVGSVCCRSLHSEYLSKLRFVQLCIGKIDLHTGKGDIRLLVCLDAVEVPLADGVVLRLAADGGAVASSLCVPLRGYLNVTDVCTIRPEPLEGSRDWTRDEYAARLAEALKVAIRPVPPEEVVERVFEEGPLTPGYWERLFGKRTGDARGGGAEGETL